MLGSPCLSYFYAIVRALSSRARLFVHVQNVGALLALVWFAVCARFSVFQLLVRIVRALCPCAMTSCCDVRQSTLAASVSIGSNLILPLYPKKKKRKMLIDIFYMYSVFESRVWHSPISR